MLCSLLCLLFYSQEPLTGIAVLCSSCGTNPVDILFYTIEPTSNVQQAILLQQQQDKKCVAVLFISRGVPSYLRKLAHYLSTW